MKHGLIFLFLVTFHGAIFAEILCGEVKISTFQDEKAFFLLKKNNFIYQKYRLIDKAGSSVIKFLIDQQGYCLEGDYVATYPVSFAVSQVIALRY